VPQNGIVIFGMRGSRILGF